MKLVKTLIYILWAAFIGFAIFFTLHYLSNAFVSERAVNASSETVQFEPNLRFNHNQITYSMHPDCSPEKEARMLAAFLEISSGTGIISFKPAEETDADILVACSEGNYEEEKNVFISGEGGPTEYFSLPYYSLIKKAKILLYEESACSKPITEIHELLHVFGFDHISKKEFILYPYIACSQGINPGVIAELKRLYSIEPLPELSISNATASRNGKYLNFSVRVNNEGLLDAKNAVFNIFADDAKIETSDLKIFEAGASQVFFVDNLLLPSPNAQSIKFSLVYSGKEFRKDNNEVEVAV